MTNMNTQTEMTKKPGRPKGFQFSEDSKRKLSQSTTGKPRKGPLQRGITWDYNPETGEKEWLPGFGS